MCIEPRCGGSHLDSVRDSCTVATIQFAYDVLREIPRFTTHNCRLGSIPQQVEFLVTDRGQVNQTCVYCAYVYILYSRILLNIAKKVIHRKHHFSISDVLNQVHIDRINPRVFYVLQRGNGFKLVGIWNRDVNMYI